MVVMRVLSSFSVKGWVTRTRIVVAVRWYGGGFGHCIPMVRHGSGLIDLSFTAWLVYLLGDMWALAFFRDLSIECLYDWVQF